jgi:hypothetical protein
MITAPWDQRPVGKLSFKSWRGLTSGQTVEDDFRLQWRDRAGFSPASTAMTGQSYDRLPILVNRLLRLSVFLIYTTSWITAFASPFCAMMRGLRCSCNSCSTSAAFAFR